ncbi:MAG TPA: hypothetical protein PKC25_09070, partial [Candidatus Rifleibacterium sp.]|nr:hypothetical protein [Candidatus Rifleibacterium sp.]
IPRLYALKVKITFRISSGSPCAYFNQNFAKTGARFRMKYFARHICQYWSKTQLQRAAPVTGSVPQRQGFIPLGVYGYVKNFI